MSLPPRPTYQPIADAPRLPVEANTNPAKTPPRGFAEISDNWEVSSEERFAAKKAEVNAKLAAKHLQLQERDIVIINFLARYRYAQARQLAIFLRTSEKATSIRLGKMAAAGFLRKDKITNGQVVWTPLLAGLSVADSDFPVVARENVSMSTMAHELGLVNIGIALELGEDNILGEDTQQPERVLTTREIRSAQPQWNSGVSHLEIVNANYKALEAWHPAKTTPELLPGGQSMFALYTTNYGDHTPDMVVARERLSNGEPQSVAIEMELSRKDTRELTRIFSIYKESRIFGSVVYFTDKKPIRDRVLKVAIEVGLETLRVRKYAPRSGGLAFWG